MALAAAAAATLAAGSPLSARPLTTTPGQIYIVPATMTDAKIIIKKDKLFKNGFPTYPRGAIIRYSISNTTKKVLVFQMWNAKTKPIKPGHKDSMLVNWNYRGKFVFRMVYNGKTYGALGHVTVF